LIKFTIVAEKIYFFNPGEEREKMDTVNDAISTVSSGVDEDLTFKLFGYSKASNQFSFVVAVCPGCGKVRITQLRWSDSLCAGCNKNHRSSKHWKEKSWNIGSRNLYRLCKGEGCSTQVIIDKDYCSACSPDVKIMETKVEEFKRCRGMI